MKRLIALCVVLGALLLGNLPAATAAGPAEKFCRSLVAGARDAYSNIDLALDPILFTDPVLYSHVRRQVCKSL